MLFFALSRRADCSVSSGDPLPTDIDEQWALLGRKTLFRNKDAGNDDVIGERQRRRDRTNPGYLSCRIYTPLEHMLLHWVGPRLLLRSQELSQIGGSNRDLATAV
jgi:hypothetical protein